jgi:hypothetical protein
MSRGSDRRRALAALAAGALVVGFTAPALGDLRLPPGFAAEVYVSGQGFDAGRSAGGIPATSTLALDRRGWLYLARTGRRYSGGEVDDLTAVYRVPPGGARLSVDTEARFLYGPPLRNPQTPLVRGDTELIVTTFDRDRRLGVVYRVVDGRPHLLAGGTPPPGSPPLLRQPEGVAADSAGRLYVADRAAGAVVRLDAEGRVLDRAYVAVRRPRVLAIDRADTLWIAGDGDADAPWQQGPGEIWRVPRDGTAALVHRGNLAAGIALGPEGHLFVADRHAGEIFVLTPAGSRLAFARYGDGDAPRALAFAPDTPETRRAGIAGSLFVVTINAGAWPVNDVVRISGPFGALAGRAAAGSR